MYHTCLNYKSTPQKGEITAEHIDLFELFPQQKRFNQFVGGYNGENLSTERRLGLVQLLLDKFAQLHKIGIAHRDLGNHRHLAVQQMTKLRYRGLQPPIFI